MQIDLFQKADADVNNPFSEKIVNAISVSGAMIAIEENVTVEYKKLNTFLNVNAWKTKSHHDLSFGDVLQDMKSKSYYICVSALCECAVRVNKTGKQDFFFIEALAKRFDETEEAQMQNLSKNIMHIGICYTELKI